MLYRAVSHRNVRTGMAMAVQKDKVVSIVACREYRREQVFEAVSRAVGMLGGIGVFVSPGQRVFVKPNLLQGSRPDACVTTHPEVIYAVAKILKDHGCTVVIGDSPGAGIPYNERSLKKIYAATGLDALRDELGVSLNYDTGSSTRSSPDGMLMKQFPIINPALEADAVIVVSKAKTHLWTRMSGAAKNLFGLIPGLEKPAFHFRCCDEAQFGAMLVDLNELVQPRLQIMDAISGMEGDGPQSGTPRTIGAILASADYTAMDVVVARLIGMDPIEIGTIRSAVARGLVKEDFSDVHTVGEDPVALKVEDFKKPSTYLGSKQGLRRSLLLTLVQKLGRIYALRPGIIREKCIGCGKCRRICPVQAITIAEGKAEIDPGSCIRCYCCHEMCSDHAIGLSRSRTGKILAKIIR